MYLGGGTPSLLEPEQIGRLLDILSRFYDLSKIEECSLEANPENLSREKIEAYRRLKISRLSLGVQSWAPNELKRIERLATYSQMEKCIENVRECFENFSLDLMIGIPEQSLESLNRSLDKLLSFSPPHLSIYLLTIAQEHIWFHSKTMKALIPAEDTAAEFYEFVCKKLGAAFYKHYEVSNFAKGNKRSLHNSNYWNNQSGYLGLGPGAHSYFVHPPTRCSNILDMKAWVESETGFMEAEILSEEQQSIEAMYLNLRTRKELQFSDFDAALVEQLVNEGLLERQSSDTFSIAEPHWALLDAIAERLLRGRVARK